MKAIYANPDLEKTNYRRRLKGKPHLHHQKPWTVNKTDDKAVLFYLFLKRIIKSIFSILK